MNNSVELLAVKKSIDELEKKVADSVEIAVAVLNGNASRAGDAKKAIDDSVSDVKKALALLNKALAREYYIETPLFDIIKNGKACPVRGYSVTVDDSGKYGIEISDSVEYPTVAGMHRAGILPDGIADRIDLLRREVAYIESGKTAKVFLTGDAENKRDIPSKKVAELIEKEGPVSVNKAKATLQNVLHTLTGGEYKKDVFTPLYKDFAHYIVKRGNEWTERNMVSKGTAGDMVLEYAYMYFNNLREVKYTLG